MIKMIIGVAGPAGSGKDTVGKWFADTYGFHTYAMASPLKAGLAAMGLPEPSDRALKEQPVPGFNFTWREAAQKLGTEWGRGLDKDLWLRLAEQHIQELDDSVVVTDIRFENEAAMIRAIGGTMLHVMGRKVELGNLAAHASENPVLFYPISDYMLDNRGTLEELHQQLEDFMNG